MESNAGSTSELHHQHIYASLIGNGIAFGIIHVLSGPDHLGALVTLSANVGSFKAFTIGVGWGIGHTAGLLVVATILLLAFNTGAGTLDISEKAIQVVESLIGVFMILLGIYGFATAVRRHQNAKAVLQNFEQQSLSIEEQPEALNDIDMVALDKGESKLKDSFCEIENDASSSSHSTKITIEEQSTKKPISGFPDTQDPSYSNIVNDVCATSTKPSLSSGRCLPELTDCDITITNVEKHNGQHNTSNSGYSIFHSHGTVPTELHTKSETWQYKSCCLRWYRGESSESRSRNAAADDCSLDQQSISTCRIQRKQCLSFLMGIIHGVAGPGGVLGIVPAIQLQNLGMAYTYLSSFCISSIITMGIFASLFGLFTASLSNITRFELQIECLSAALCAVVGVVWISLSLTDKHLFE
mmetsp:Transcript_13956/g.19976  ORF Transcript_13956/g.19976 Transcript_13956/m.19976 type:complete len:413 (+) Transcript_13956:32-1270(+)